MLFIIFLLYMCYHFVLKTKQFFLLHTKPHNIFNYFQQTAYSELIMFWYYTLQTKNFTRVIEKLKIAIFLAKSWPWSANVVLIC